MSHLPRVDDKVSSKWYPPDFDPSIASKRSKAPKGNKPKPVTLMVPFSMRCTNSTCGAFIGRGTKFNAKKETMDEKYLNIPRYRFYIRCRGCHSELSFCTDPQNGDYVCEKGVQPLTKSRIHAKNDQTDAEIVDHLQSLIEEEEIEEENDKMAELEDKMQDKMQDSKRDMAVADALDEIRVRNARIERNAQQGTHEVAQKGVHEVAQKGVHEVSQKGIHEVAQKGVEVHPKYNHLVPQKGVQFPEFWSDSAKAHKKEFPDFVKVDRWEISDIEVPFDEQMAMDKATADAFVKEKSYRLYHDVHGNYLIRDLKARVVYLMPPEEEAQGLHKVKDAWKNYPPHNGAPVQPVAAAPGEWEIVEVLDFDQAKFEAEMAAEAAAEKAELEEKRKRRAARTGLKFPKGFKLRRDPDDKPGDKSDVRAKDISK